MMSATIGAALSGFHQIPLRKHKRVLAQRVEVLFGLKEFLLGGREAFRIPKLIQLQDSAAFGKFRRLEVYVSPAT